VLAKSCRGADAAAAAGNGAGGETAARLRLPSQLSLPSQPCQLRRGVRLLGAGLAYGPVWRVRHAQLALPPALQEVLPQPATLEATFGDGR